MSPAAPSAEDSNSPVLLRALRRFWVPIVVAVVLGAVFGHTASQLQSVRYTAESRLVLSKVVSFDPLGTYVNADASRFIANQISILTSEPVLEAATRQLPGTTVESLRDAISAAGGSDDDVISVRATAPTAQGAKARADAVAEAYEAFRLARVTDQTRAALRETTSEDVQSTIRTQASTYGSGLSLVQPAVLPKSPSRPLPNRDAFVLAVVYGLLAIGYALLRGSRPTHAERITATAARLDVPVLGRIPGGAPAAALTATGSTAAEAYQMLLVTLDYLSRHSPRTLLVTSSTEGGGTSTAESLAVVAARRGMRVSLVDGSTSGLSALSGSDRLLLHARPGSFGGSPQHGTRDGAGMLEKRTGGPVPLTEVHESPDLVIIDSPPVARRADAYAMVSAADAVIFVVDDRTKPSDVLEADDRLRFAGARLTGLVLLDQPKPTLRSLRPPRFRERASTRPAGMVSDVEASTVRPRVTK
jgi:capsular polysaccharide biosynthesis protein